MCCFHSDSYAYSLKTKLNSKDKLVENLSSDDRKTIESALDEHIQWIESNPNADIHEIKEHKRTLENLVTSIISETHKQNDSTDQSSTHQHDHETL